MFGKEVKDMLRDPIRLRDYPDMDYTLQLILSYQDGSTYEVPNSWRMTDIGTFDINNKLQDVVLLNGSILSGSNKVSGRKITLETYIKDLNADTYRLSVNTLYQKFHQLNYKVIIPNINLYYSIAGVSKFKATEYEGFKGQYSKIQITLLLGDPFFKSIDLNKVTTVLDSEKKEFEIPLYVNSAVQTPAIVTITPLNKSTRVDNVYLLKRGTKEYFQYKDAQLAYPFYTVINTENGTSYRINRDTLEENNTLKSLEGIFLTLDPGLCTLVYTGSPCTLEISYRGLWYI